VRCTDSLTGCVNKASCTHEPSFNLDLICARTITTVHPPSRVGVQLVVDRLCNRWGRPVSYGVVLWQAHLDRQITHVEELGLARDVQWLGANKYHWLLRPPSGVLLTLEVLLRGWVMGPDVLLLRKTASKSHLWACDASLAHCIPTADEKHTLVGRVTP